jgi:hypothetical protein
MTFWIADTQSMRKEEPAKRIEEPSGEREVFKLV